MAKLLFIILANFSISINCIYGGTVCDYYEDINCVHPDIVKDGHYTNQWAVHLPDVAKDEVKQLLEDYGYVYLRQIMDGLHLVTKDGIPEKHLMPNNKVIEHLRNHEKIRSVEQKNVIRSPSDDYANYMIENDVIIQHIDPDSIVLNDGKENYARAQQGTSSGYTYRGYDSSSTKEPEKPPKDLNQDHETSSEILDKLSKDYFENKVSLGEEIPNDDLVDDIDLEDSSEDYSSEDNELDSEFDN